MSDITETITQEGQRIVLKLKNQSSTLDGIKNVKDNDFFKKASKTNVNSVETITDVLKGMSHNDLTIEDNERKLGDMFNGLIESINNQREEAKGILRSIPSDQQNEFLKFAKQFTEFFHEFFKMLSQWMKKIVQVITQIGTSVWNVIKDISSYIKSLF